MKKIKILLIDNYDSFTYNLYHLVSSIDQVSLQVRRNDENYLDELNEGVYDAVIIGPGPGSPTDQQYFGNSLQVIKEYGTKGLPILGVCLGFQGIAHAFGASLKRAKLPMHGKLSQCKVYKQDTLFTDITEPPMVMRYHSLMIDADQPLPNELIITAEVSPHEKSVSINGREIMALEHRKYPIFGVQFHPESFATDTGLTIIENFLIVSGKMPERINR